jgi:hypothetical protein
MELIKFLGAWGNYKGIRILSLSNYITVYADDFVYAAPHMKHPTYTEYIQIDLTLGGTKVCTTFLKEVEMIDRFQWLFVPIRFIPTRKEALG